jgi:hypothetical protein
MPFIDNQLGVLVKRGEVVYLDQRWYRSRVKDTEERSEGISDKVHLLDTLQLIQIIGVNIKSGNQIHVDWDRYISGRVPAKPKLIHFTILSSF